jgi:hypothetical protein
VLEYLNLRSDLRPFRKQVFVEPVIEDPAASGCQEGADDAVKTTGGKGSPAPLTATLKVKTACVQITSGDHAEVKLAVRSVLNR